MAGQSEQRQSGQSRLPRAELDALSAQLPALEAFARREVGACVRGGQLQAGALDPAELVDSVILRALQRPERIPPESELRGWLLGLALRSVREEVGRVRGERRRAVPLDENIGEFPEGDDLPPHRSWEDVDPEQILPFLDLATPDQPLEWSELAPPLADAVAALPLRWREAFALCASESLAPREAARALGREAPDVERDLALARAFIREKLLEAGALDAGAPRPADP